MKSSEAGTVVLVVDKDPQVRREIQDALRGRVSVLLDAESGREALDLVLNRRVDLVTSGIYISGMNGLGLLEEIKRRSPDTEVLIITEDTRVESAVEATQRQAFGYLLKPIRHQELHVQVTKALESVALRRENQELRRRVRDHTPWFVGRSPTIRRLLTLVQQIAPTVSSVLLVGETGTGKELLAEEIHARSGRAHDRLVRVDCAALAEDLVESELFGHVRGAFTGAIADRPGRFELADGGTLFLDGVGDMSLTTQQRLLRVLQRGELERVGSSKTIQVDVRLIAATNRDLREAIAEGRFREDLFYRLCVIELAVPPLRERREDVPYLAQYFLREFAARVGKRVTTISPAAHEILSQYSWPGNVRELKHAIESAAIFCTGDSLLPEMLPQDILDACGLSQAFTQGHAEIHIPLGLTLKEAEREVARQTLAAVGGDKRRAGEVLGLSRSSLYRKLRRPLERSS